MAHRLALAILFTSFALAASAWPRATHAHGLWGHIHVTGWAIENLPPGELRDFFADPEVFNAALWGSAFPDSGYFPQAGALAERARDYGEHAHWEPYVQDYVAWMIANDPPPWTTLASQQRVAFLLGNAAHGLQDELFDSLMLALTLENDAAGRTRPTPGRTASSSRTATSASSPRASSPWTPCWPSWTGAPPPKRTSTRRTT